MNWFYPILNGTIGINLSIRWEGNRVTYGASRLEAATLGQWLCSGQILRIFQKVM